MIIMDYAREIAKAALDIGAIKLNAEEPFTWASGFRMPIYNDNRKHLGYPENRRLIAAGLALMIHEYQIPVDVIAGTATAGISPATTLADLIERPLTYVRSEKKEHGLKNKIEGLPSHGYDGQNVLVIEDLISTGGSSARVVQAVRDAGGKANWCLSIFNYNLETADDIFSGNAPLYENGPSLNPPCNVRSLLTYETLLEVAKETGKLTDEQYLMLEQWRENPEGWGAKYGFPKIEK